MLSLGIFDNRNRKYRWTVNHFYGRESRILMIVLFLYKDGGISWSKRLRGNFCSSVASVAREVKAATLEIFGSSISRTVNGDNSPQMGNNHSTDPTTLFTTMSMIIRSSFSEEERPAKSGTILFVFWTWRAELGRK